MNFIKMSGYVWSMDEEDIPLSDAESLEDALGNVLAKHNYDFDLVFKVEDKPDALEKPWPEDKTLYDLDREFDELGIANSEEFGLLWLQANNAVRNGILYAGVEAWDRRVRWLAFNIARGVCLWIKENEEKPIETES